MWTGTLFAVLALVAASHADIHADMATLMKTPGAQYKLYQEKVKTITLNSDDLDDTFDGLDIAPGNDITIEDLKIHYWYEELAFAQKKFMKMIEEQCDGKVTKEELKDDLDDISFRTAMIECHYLKAEGLKQSCFADQMLTYVALVMDDAYAEKFFNELAGTDKKLDKNEVAKLKTAKYTDEFMIAEELGVNDQAMGTKEEFIEFVTQETINDDFRRCRDKIDAATGFATYKSACLKEELVEYIHDDLTELDSAVLYRYVDTSNDGKITRAELAALPLIGEKNADKALERLDMSITTSAKGQEIIDYGEWRTFLMSPTVQIQLERTCIEPHKNQKDEITCMYTLFQKLAIYEDDIWLIEPDLEQLIAFESMDDNEDGVIKSSELQWEHTEAVEKFMDEFDHDKEKIDNTFYVCLEEFNEGIDIPHMVYGTSDCLLADREVSEDGRVPCYENEIKGLMSNIMLLNNQFFKDWFKKYDKSGDGYITLDDVTKAPEMFTLDGKKMGKVFVEDLGQGDDIVTEFEFTWYVKQEELTDYYGSENYNDKNEPICAEFQKDLLTYIRIEMTEYDTASTFDALDTCPKNHELSPEDFKDAAKKDQIVQLLKKIDAVEENGDKDNNVHFRELWLWLESDYKGKPVKDIFEKECTQKINGEDEQKREIQCYKDLIVKTPEIFLEE